jgi:hypothetical protein
MCCQAKQASLLLNLPEVHVGEAQICKQHGHGGALQIFEQHYGMPSSQAFQPRTSTFAAISSQPSFSPLLSVVFSRGRLEFGETDLLQLDFPRCPLSIPIRRPARMRPSYPETHLKPSNGPRIVCVGERLDNLTPVSPQTLGDKGLSLSSSAFVDTPPPLVPRLSFLSPRQSLLRFLWGRASILCILPA